jgi:Tol biopolymer transport system component
MATSNNSLRIAWNRSDIDYTDPDLIGRVVNGVSEVWTGELRYQYDGVWVDNVALVMDRTAVAPLSVLEVQDFRPRTHELIFSAFAYQGTEVMGVNLQTGTVTNYSNSPVFEEAHGVAPNGAWVLTGRNLNSITTPGPVDIWLLPLDGSQAWDRLTRFNRYRGWYASNPEVNPGGTQFAFMVAFDGAVVGEGRGILLFDLAASGRPTAPPVSTDASPHAPGSPEGECPPTLAGSPHSGGCSVAMRTVKGNATWYSVTLAGLFVARRRLRLHERA